MKTWPATLPQRMDGAGYEEGTGDGRLRSQTDAGPVKMRRRFSAVPRPLSVQTRMSGAQLAAFETFVRDDIGGGTLPFVFPAQRGSGTWIVQLGPTMPKWTARPGNWWMVQMDLVILP